MHVCVEWRADEQCGAILNLLAGAAVELGHQVCRWRHEGQPWPDRGTPVCPCDAAVLWNGFHPVYSRPRKQLKQWGARTIFAELGWLPQDGTFQLDPAGVNAGASWVAERVGQRTGELVQVASGDLLVCLQDDNDSQMCYSPWFAGAQPFLEHLAHHAQLPMRIRAHPLFPARGGAKRIVAGYPRMTWDDSPTLDQSMGRARAMAVINSTCGLAALQAGLPLLCFGRAVYSQPGAVWQFDGTLKWTYSRTMQLKHRRCDLDRGTQQATLRWVLGHQYTAADLPGCLAAHLGE